MNELDLEGVVLRPGASNPEDWAKYKAAQDKAMSSPLTAYVVDSNGKRIPYHPDDAPLPDLGPHPDADLASKLAYARWANSTSDMVILNPPCEVCNRPQTIMGEVPSSVVCDSCSKGEDPPPVKPKLIEATVQRLSR